EQIQNSITEKNQNLSNIEYKENQSIDSLENFFNTYSNWETYCQEIEKYLNLKKINSNEDSLKFLITYSNLSDVKKRI
ncbi:UNVERIFIED_CONTAM: hypothetical protein LJA33_08790, partial [Campylobacter jejuni]